MLPAPGGLLVRRTSVGSVARRGMRPGDTILAVDGASTARLSYHEAVGRILGRPGDHGERSASDAASTRSR